MAAEASAGRLDDRGLMRRGPRVVGSSQPLIWLREGQEGVRKVPHFAFRTRKAYQVLPHSIPNRYPTTVYTSFLSTLLSPPDATLQIPPVIT